MRYASFLFGGVIAFVVVLLYMDVSILHLSNPISHLGYHLHITNDKPSIEVYSNKEKAPPFQNVEQNKGRVDENDMKSSIHYKTSTSLRKDAVRPILTFYLQNEVDIEMKQVIQHNKDWEKRFDSLLHEVQTNYMSSQDRLFHTERKDASYSSIQIEWVEHMNSAYIYAEQVCRDFQTGKYYVYSQGKEEINFKQVAHQFFRWGWHFKYKHKPFPTSVPPISDDGYMVFQPFLPRHITHFAECVNHLLNKLGDRSAYTPLTHVYLPLLEESTEFEWTKTYISLLVSLFPESSRPQILFSRNSTQSNTPSIECFNSVTLLDRLAYNKDGGIFGGFFPQDMMRGISYRHAATQPKQEDHSIHLLFLERSRGRRWMRKHTYLKLLRLNFPMLNITTSSLNGLSYKEQVMLYYHSDIVLGGHGSAMTNSMFMMPHSVLIECNPPFFYEMCFANIAWLSRVHYISVTNYNPEYLPAKLKNAEKLYQAGSFFKKRREFAQYNIYPNALQLVSAVDDAIQFVNRWRFLYVTNQDWSRVFY